MTKDEKLKQKYMQFQLIQQQIEQVSNHVEALNQQNAELEISQKAIQELQKTSPNTEILAPIANGIFFKTELKDNQNLIINVGNNVTVEKSMDKVVTLLEQQKEQLTEQLREADTVLQELTAQAMKIYQEVEELAED